MAAIVENSENGQMGNNLAYSQSSGSDSLHSSESALDTSNTSTKATDFSPSPKVNGLSHLDDGSQLQKAGANIQCSGTVKVDIPHTLVTCGVTKSEKDFSEKPVAEMDFQPALSLSLPVARSAPHTKDEEKVKFKVPFDSNSNCFSSVQNSESQISPCDVNDTKESGLEQKDGIKFKIQECKTAEQFPSSENAECKEKPPISENEMSNKTSTLEDKNLQSDFNDNKLFKSVETISVDSNMDDVCCQDKKTMSSKSATAYNATLKIDSADMTAVADEKVSGEGNSKNYSESSNSQTFSRCQSKTKAAKSSGVSNIPKLLAYCSPCQVVVQDFFKELNIDLLELSRNFPVRHGHRKQLKNSKSVQTPIHVEEQIKNNSFDSHNRTKQAKGYTENSKRRKKHLPLVSESLNNPVEDDDEDEEDNLPLLSVRNNLNQSGNTAADTGKSGAEEKFKSDGNERTTKGENFKQIKGGNSDAITEVRALTNSTSSDVPVTTPSNPEAANPFQKMELLHVSPTVNINDSNDLGLKIVSVSSQGSVFFPAFTSDNSENIVFNHSDTDSKLNGQLDATCGNSTAKLSPPKCKFHGPNSSPIQNLYKCKKCGLEVKSLSDIQAHMAGSHSEFCMYRCPFCVPPLPVKRVGVYNSRPIEFEVLRESSRKLMASPSSPKTTSSAVSAKRKMPRHIRIQREKRRKLNYYYRNQREIKKYKNEKVSCQYCHKLINQSNISRHQNSKICTNPRKKIVKRSLIRDRIPKKYQKVKCNTCHKRISRTNMSKHSRICPRENDD